MQANKTGKNTEQSKKRLSCSGGGFEFSSGNGAGSRGTQREYSSKPLKHSIVKRILVFKR